MLQRYLVNCKGAFIGGRNRRTPPSKLSKHIGLPTRRG